DPTLRNGLQRGEADREEVKRLSDRLAVEISTGDDLTVLEHEWVVGRGVELDQCSFLREPERIGDSAKDLGGAAQTVGVLHPGIVLAMRLPDLAVFQQVAHHSRGLALARMGASVMDAGIERRRRSPKRLH